MAEVDAYGAEAVSLPAAADRREGEGERLTVLHVTAPARVGGLERVVTALSSGHARRGHEVHVAAALTESDESHPFIAGLRQRGVHVHVGVLSSRAYLGELRWLSQLCRELKPDIVHTHGYRSDLLGGAAARRLGIPLAATVHGFVRGSAKGRFYEWLQRRSYRRFDLVAAVSRPQVEELLGEGVSAARVELVPNGWEGPLAAEGEGSESVTEVRTRDGFHLGWVGRLSHEKGADVLVRALPELADLPVVLSVVGDGPAGEGLRQLAVSLGVEDRLRWLGMVDNAASLFPSFDVFVLSSRTEGTPIVLFEAMAARTPIVAASVGGVPDVVGDDGAILVPPDDPSALAAAIRKVAKDRPAALARAERAHARLRDRYDLDRWLDRYESLYRALQQKKRRISR